ncbi:MAG: PCRF domain-containing protein, partial [Proteobacteria bacterium]|nr:PCRF domain-containing protein [Pseudomonadota bacterium]
MTPSLIRKLEALAERHEEVARLLAQPDALTDPKRFRDLSREFAQLEPVAHALHDYQRAQADLAAALALRED